jgi:hypothetical protein
MVYKVLENVKSSLVEEVVYLRHTRDMLSLTNIGFSVNSPLITSDSLTKTGSKLSSPSNDA